jgi:linearmycin/streptolysin S transport system ATP-binding protein
VGFGVPESRNAGFSRAGEVKSMFAMTEQARIRVPRDEKSLSGAPGRSSLLSCVPRPRQQPLKIVALRVDSLQKRYGEIDAVAGVSFDVREGEVFGLLGPNGAGKTTVISIIATERAPSGGDAKLFDHSIRTEPKAVRRMIGVAPQDIAIYPKLTAAENLRFFGRIYGVSRAVLESRIGQLLHLVGLESRGNDYAGTFSGGMKRRLNLAAALVHSPRILLLDEPTAGVDPQSREHIFEIVRGLREAGTAILYTTQYMEEAEGLCDRLGIMNRGKIVAMGSLDALLANLECAEIIELRGLPPGTDLGPVEAAGGVCRVDRTDNIVRLFVTSAAPLLEALQKIISRSRQPVHLKIAPVSLEHLFLRLTGTELHD